jgi:hypothetical protein
MLEQLRAPQPGQPEPKGPQAVEVSRHRVVVEVALHDRPEPRSASPKPPSPIGECFLTLMAKIQATVGAFHKRGLFRVGEPEKPAYSRSFCVSRPTGSGHHGPGTVQ